MSIDSSPVQSSNTDASHEAQLEEQRDAEVQRHARQRHHRIGHHHSTTFKHAQPTAQHRKPHTEEGRHRLAAAGLPHKLGSGNGERGQRHHQGGGQNGRGGSQHQQKRQQQQREQSHQQRRQQRKDPQNPQKRPPLNDSPGRRPGEREPGQPGGNAWRAPRGEAGALAGVGAAGAAGNAMLRSAAAALPPVDGKAKHTGSAPRLASAAATPRTNPLRALFAGLANRPLMVDSELPKQLADLQLRTGSSPQPTLAQIELMLDSLDANELLAATLRGRLDTLEQVIQLLLDAHKRRSDLGLPNGDTEAGQTWFALTPLVMLSLLRQLTPASLRARAARQLGIARNTLKLPGTGKGAVAVMPAREYIDADNDHVDNDSDEPRDDDE
jgi:hypothetical protein